MRPWRDSMPATGGRARHIDAPSGMIAMGAYLGALGGTRMERIAQSIEPRRLLGRRQPGVVSGWPGDPSSRAARDGHALSPDRRLVLEPCRMTKLTSVLPAVPLRPTRE